jgi:hypothetical protein
MRKLPEIIKPWADKVFAVNPKKYRLLIQWIHGAERTYKAEHIATALERFYPHANDEKLNWWGYLDRTIEDVEGKQNGRESEAEHNARKEAEAEFARATFGGREIRKDTRQNR